MFRIHADHPNHTITVNDLALVTDFFDRSPDFHFAVILFVAVDDSAPAQIIRRKFDRDLVSRKDPNEILSHFSRDVGQDHVFAFQFDTEHGIG